MDLVEGKVQFYGFADHIEPGKTVRQVVREVAAQPGVRFVAQFTGRFLVFAAAEHESLDQAQDAIGDAYLGAGFRTEWSMLLRSSRLMAPKRGSPDYCAIVRAQAEGDPETTLRAIDDRFEERFQADPTHERFSYGAGVVTGADFDLLVDLGADSTEELTRTLLRDLRTVDGVGRTSTSIAFLPDNAIRPGQTEAS